MKAKSIQDVEGQRALWGDDDKLADQVESRMLTAEAVAAQLSVSQRKVWSMRSSGALPEPVKLVGSTRWRSRDIDRWIAFGCPSRTVFDARMRGRDAR